MPQVPHICHVSLALKGGPASVVRDLVSWQLSVGMRVSIVYSPVRDNLDEVRKMFPREVEFYPVRSGRNVALVEDFWACIALDRTLRALKPDILHLHSSKAGGLGRLVARLRGMPMIYSPHAISFLRQDVTPAVRAGYFGAEFLLGFLGGAIVANSKSELAAMHWLPGQKLCIQNGVPFEEYQSVVAAPRSGQGKFRIVLCGRVTAQKNPALACEIANACPPNWDWYWIGDGELRNLVETSSHIRVLGWMDRRQAWREVAAADVFVQTSLWEGMPIAVLEAMALGRPVVATDVVGTRDLVQNGVTGILAQTPEQFVRALRELADKPEYRRRFGGGGHARVKDEFDLAVLQQQWAELYRAMSPLAPWS